MSLLDRKGFKILPDNGAKFFIVQSVTWENQTTRNKCETQLGVRTIVTLAITPLVLVMDDSNTREASRVTLGR